MKFAFTSFDKAILAAVLAPIISLLTSYLNGGALTQNDLIAAVVAAAVAGLAVYLKANAVPTPVQVSPPTPPAA